MQGGAYKTHRGRQGGNLDITALPGIDEDAVTGKDVIIMIPVGKALPVVGSYNEHKLMPGHRAAMACRVFHIYDGRGR